MKSRHGCGITRITWSRDEVVTVSRQTQVAAHAICYSALCLALLLTYEHDISVAILPVNPERNEERHADVMMAAIHSANRQISNACGARAEFTFLDMAGELADSGGRLGPSWDAGDGLHLSPSGSVVWMRNVHDALTLTIARTKNPGS